jgi:hypothetical protein
MMRNVAMKLSMPQSAQILPNISLNIFIRLVEGPVYWIDAMLNEVIVCLTKVATSEKFIRAEW